MIDAEEHERIKFDRDTLDILRGADDVRDRLLIEMATGVPAISSMAYAIKVRVKEDFKIAEKVTRKRVENNDPDYNVSRLRDIVGLRLVTLYRLDALKVIPYLLDKIQKAPDNSTALFVRNEIEEIIIYGTNSAGDAQTLTSRLLAMFESRGLRCKPDVRDTVTNYSSIHMVVWCRGRYNDGYRRIPVEVQVRTALEDVWGEIEHGLKYKKRSRVSDPRETKSLESSEAHLNVMKSLIDGLAQYADQIKIQFDQIDIQRLRGSSSRLAEDGLERVREIEGLPAPLSALVEAAILQAQGAITQGRDETVSRSEHLKSLLSSLNSLNKAYGTVSRVPGLLEKQVTELRYVLGMERALLMFEVGNDTDEGNLLVESQRIYARLEQINPDVLLVLYRRARVLEALGDREASIGKLTEVVNRLRAKDALLPADHWLRASVLRLLGVFTWERGFKILAEAHPSPSPEQAREATRAFLSAFTLTLPVRDVASATEEDRRKAANNLFWYALDFLDGGGDQAELEAAGFTAELADEWLAALGANEPENITDVRHANTAARAHYRRQQRELAARAARRTIELLAADGVTDENASVHDADMLRASRAVLEGETGIRW